MLQRNLRKPAGTGSTSMPDPQNLPYLIRLLDDDSEVVRESVLKELSSFGPFLEIELSRSNVRTSDEQRHQIRNLLGVHARQWLRDHWTSVGEAKGEKEQLEQAAGLIAQFQYGPGYPVTLSDLLGKVTHEFLKRDPAPTVLSLASYLFKTRGLRGAESDYYNPFHSNLVYVLEEGRGNPLSLSCIYMLIGWRVGLDIEGCNFPGHFLTRARNDRETFVVDCFNGGRFLEKADILSVNKGAAAQLRSLLEGPCPTATILARMLRNLIHAYRQEDKPEHVTLFSELLQPYRTSNDSRDDESA